MADDPNQPGGLGTPMPPVGAPVPDIAPEQPEYSRPFPGSQGPPGPLPNYQQRWQSGESGPGLSPRPSKWDKIVGGVTQGVQNSMMGGTVPNYLSEKLLNTGVMIPPAQANQIDPLSPTPYTTPVDSGVLSMRAANNKSKADMQEWLGRNDVSGAGFGRFVGGLVDVPLYSAVGLATGGAADWAIGGVKAGATALGEFASPTVGKLVGGAASIASHYAWSLGEFSAVGELQNKMETSMGAVEKPFGEIVHESLVGAAIATGLGALARKFSEKTPVEIQQGIKDNVGAMVQDQKLPPVAAPEAKPTLVTSPTATDSYHAAVYNNGAHAVHETGLGDGAQVIRDADAAREKVAGDATSPGQTFETKLPENAKLLDLDSGLNTQKALVEAIEAKTGLPLSEDLADSKESVRALIQNLGDWAGAEIGGKPVPEDILSQIQAVAKEQGYTGYEFKDTKSGASVAHVFDPTGMPSDNHQPAIKDPSANPVPETPPRTPEEALQKSQSFDPETHAELDKISKTSKTLHPDNAESRLKEIQDTLAEHKAQLQELAKENPVAAQQLESLREDEAANKIALDTARRIMNCAGTE